MPSLGLGSSLTSSGAVAESVLVNSYSMHFDATDAYIDIAGGSVDIGKTGTVSLWVKFDGSGEIAHHPLGDEAYGSGGYHFYPVSASGVSHGMYVNFRTESEHWNDTTTKGHMTDLAGGSEWQQWGYTRANDTVILYINGVSMGTKTLGDDPDGILIDTIGAGKHGGDPYNEWEGYIDEVAAWNVALDADAVLKIYNSGTPIDLTINDGNYDNSSNLQAYWRFEQGTGTSAIDSSGNSNTGTLTNSPTFSSTTP